MVGRQEEEGKVWRELVYFPVVFNIVGLVAIGLLFVFSPGHAADSGTVTTVALLCVFMLEWLFALIVLTRLERQEVSLGKFLMPRKKASVLCAALVFAALTALFISYMMAGLAYGRIPPMRDFSPIQSVFFLVLVPVTAGFTEELIWRGYFMEELLAMRMSKWRSIILTSVSFASIHGIFLPDKLAVTFLFGIIAGLYYFRERNLAVLIAAHVTIDVVAYALVMFG